MQSCEPTKQKVVCVFSPFFLSIRDDHAFVCLVGRTKVWDREGENALMVAALGSKKNYIKIPLPFCG